MRVIIFILCLSFLAAPAGGQSPFFVEHPPGEVYRDVKMSLVFEASDGFLWFGSGQGLFRYDGQEYQQFLAPDSLADNNRVSAIFEDKIGRFWVGYEDGRIFQMDKDRQLKLWQPEEGLPAVRISGFGQDGDGRIWLATYGEGLYYFDGQRMYNINTDDGMLGNDVYTMVMDEKRAVYGTGTDGGISVCSVRNGEKSTVRNITRADYLPDEIVRAILPDDQGNFWIGTYDAGVCYYDTEKQVPLARYRKTGGVAGKLTGVVLRYGAVVARKVLAFFSPCFAQRAMGTGWGRGAGQSKDLRYPRRL
ncbi:MAG: hypothetical protein H6557_28810 [Lewinellaceae bacterium]|nr:hypothetical protein [Lewinellaceae bacterium]